MSYHPLPIKYDIVKGFFPDRNKITNSSIDLDDLLPFEEEHYMLVLDRMQKENRIIVAYLTSLKPKHISKGIKDNQYIIEDPIFQDTGLSVDTLLTLKNTDIVSLRYIPKYFKLFYNNKKRKLTPIVGHLDESDIHEIEKILNHPKIQEILDKLKYTKPIIPIVI